MYVAIIPVREGSQRVKNKNTKPFASSSLLEIKIRQMLRIKALGHIDEVIVNSDSKAMLELATKLGATPIEREKYYASSEVPINEALHNFASNAPGEYILLCNATSPLITDESIIACIQTFKKNFSTYDSLATTNLCKEFLYLNGKALNYDPTHKPRSQDLPDILVLNSALYIISRTLMLQKCDVVGDKPYFFTLSQLEGVDIDSELDFEIAEFLYKKYHIGGGAGDKCSLKTTQISQSAWESWRLTFGDCIAAHALDSIFAPISLDPARFTREVA